ncbi:MAG: AAA family ATPase [Methylomicrobium sp.]|nr:AAA family ATPase [Methylomicrobium sp.]
MPEQYLYVMGAESGAGKSTVCLGILAQLLSDGYAPSELAYIKPMTQCTDRQAVTIFCEQQTIEHRDAALIFRKGFTRDFIDGLTPDSAALKNGILQKIADVGANKKIVLIDGIGDPATGSIIGVSNASLAKAFSARVIFVSRPGLGAAIDNTVLCVSFINSHGLDNVGLIINNLPLDGVAQNKAYLSKRLADLLPASTVLGAIRDDFKWDKKLTAEAVNQWFSTYVKSGVLIDWMGLTPGISELSKPMAAIPGLNF